VESCAGELKKPARFLCFCLAMRILFRKLDCFQALGDKTLYVRPHKDFPIGGSCVYLLGERIFWEKVFEERLKQKVSQLSGQK
jgi:hypothetical protein